MCVVIKTQSSVITPSPGNCGNFFFYCTTETVTLSRSVGEWGLGSRYLLTGGSQGHPEKEVNRHVFPTTSFPITDAPGIPESQGAQTGVVCPPVPDTGRKGPNPDISV